LVNQFTERYRIRGRRKVRSREVQILKVESLVLKKKRECERAKGENDILEGLYIQGCPKTHVGRRPY
jgi:hypothetical protein